MFAAPWLEWRATLAKYLDALEAAKLGDLAMLENFSKKQLCQSWTPTLPDFGDGIKSRRDTRWATFGMWSDSIKILTAVNFQVAKKRRRFAHLGARDAEWDRHGLTRVVSPIASS